MKERKKFSKKITGIAALSLAVVLAIGGSLAYFTDRETISASAMAGTVNIEASNVTGSLGSDGQQGDKVLYDTDGKNILNPGDARGINYTITENGNKSVDCRDTILVTCSKAMTKGAGDDDPYQFDIYAKDDVTGYSKDTGYTLKEGAKPLAVRSIVTGDDTNGVTVLKYAPADTYTLNGTNGETENGINSTSAERGYVLVFRDDSSNDFQEAQVNVNIVTEAKQHRNTGSDWTTVATQNFDVGGTSLTVVPAAQ